MAGYLRARRLGTTVALLLVLLVTFGALGAVRARAQAKPQVPKRLAMLPLTLPADEVADLRKVSEWLVEPSAEEQDIAKEIRRDPEAFAVFAGFHTERERRDALAKVPFGREIAVAAHLHEVDSLLVASVVEVESTFRPTAGSHKGAVGLMQLLPSTAGLSRARLQNPRANLDAGAAYLAKLLDRFDGDLGLALAAYNAGPTNVRRYNGVPPFPETQQYVEKVLSRYVDYHRSLWQTSGAASLVAAVS
jgi:soluble lytic murein transglycosylase-like protein